LVTLGEEVTKIRKYYVIFARQDGQDGKNRKENHATKVTKIPKTKRQKYGMNETKLLHGRSNFFVAVHSLSSK
jgi:hypothetical protein